MPLLPMIRPWLSRQGRLRLRMSGRGRKGRVLSVTRVFRRGHCKAPVRRRALPMSGNTLLVSLGCKRCFTARQDRQTYHRTQAQNGQKQD